MKTIIKYLQRGIVMGLGIIFILGISGISYAVWNGLNAEAGDTLTIGKWNELVDKVAGVYTDSNGNVGIGTTTATRTLDVNGSIRFNGLCIDRGIYGDGSQLSNSTTNSYNISFNESFTSKPTINVTPECSSTCTGFQEDGFNIGNVSNTAFSVNWVDNSGSSSIYYLHWMAIGPCD